MIVVIVLSRDGTLHWFDGFTEIDPPEPRYWHDEPKDEDPETFGPASTPRFCDPGVLSEPEPICKYLHKTDEVGDEDGRP